jgi:hypothetical protein
MARTGKTAQRNGWKRQLDQFDLPSAGVGIAAMNPSDTAPWQALELGIRRLRTKPPIIELANDIASTRAKLAARDSALARAEQRIALLVKRVAQLEGQEPREDAAAWRLSEQAKPLAVFTANRIVELEDELRLAREELVLRDNENVSLRTSLDLSIGENSRLSDRLTEIESATKAIASQLASTKTVLTQLEGERKDLVAARNKPNPRLHVETGALKAKLEAMSSRAAAEKFLADVWESLFARSEKNSLTVGEISRLFRHLREKNIAAHIEGTRLERIKTQLTAAETERNRFAVVALEAHEKFQTEIGKLNARLAEVSTRAMAARTQFENLLRRMFGKLDQLQTSLRQKERETQSLKQGRLELLERVNTLAAAVKDRDAVLAEAMGKIKKLRIQVAELEAEQAPSGQGSPDEPKFLPFRDRDGLTAADSARTDVPANRTEAPLDDDKWIPHDTRDQERNKIRSTETLLAETVSFEVVSIKAA